MLKVTNGRECFTNKQILTIYLQQVQTSGEVFKNYQKKKIDGHFWAWPEHGMHGLVTWVVRGLKIGHGLWALMGHGLTAAHWPQLINPSPPQTYLRFQSWFC